jgi:hypothetical protein
MIWMWRGAEGDQRSALIYGLLRACSLPGFAARMGCREQPGRHAPEDFYAEAILGRWRVGITRRARPGQEAGTSGGGESFPDMSRVGWRRNCGWLVDWSCLVPSCPLCERALWAVSMRARPDRWGMRGCPTCSGGLVISNMLDQTIRQRLQAALGLCF